jgi:phosphate transport system permease protein
MIQAITCILLLVSFYYLLVNKVKIYNSKHTDKYVSTPVHYGLYVTSVNILLLILVSIILFILDLTYYWSASLILITIFSIYYFFHLDPTFKSREKYEKIILKIFAFCAYFSVIITIMIVFSILIQANVFFKEVPILNFLFGWEWNPQNEISTEIKNSFGILPVLIGTTLITVIAICIACPVGILSATYLSEYASAKTRNRIKPLIEVLAGIPTVVYGYFANITVSPIIKDFAAIMGLDISSESALCVGIVMGIMIMPYILSLTDDVISSVPQTLRDASYALGATKAETIIHVVIPAAKSGVYAAILLAVSRAVGETMIVSMAAGLSANLTFNPFESVTTATVQIVALLTGDQEFNSIKTNAAFALSLVLFVITFIINILSQIVIEKGKIKYD